MYCPTIAVRTKERVGLQSFEELLERRVHRIENLALGCGQEPTTSPQLCDFIDAVGRSREQPRGLFMLVTNGTLLHKHDWERIGNSRLNALYLSLDSIDQDTLGAVRCGSKVARIQENVTGLLEKAKNLRLHLNIVVSTRNLDGIDDVIAWGKEHGCATFTLREMYLPPTPSTEEALLQPLVLPDGRSRASSGTCASAGRARCSSSRTDSTSRRSTTTGRRGCSDAAASSGMPLHLRARLRVDLAAGLDLDRRVIDAEAVVEHLADLREQAGPAPACVHDDVRR